MSVHNSPSVPEIFYALGADHVELNFREVDSLTTYGEKVWIAALVIETGGDPLVELDRDRAQQLGRALLEGFPEEPPKEAGVKSDPHLPEENRRTQVGPTDLTREEIVRAYGDAMRNGHSSMVAELAGIYPFLRQDPPS